MAAMRLGVSDRNGCDELKRSPLSLPPADAPRLVPVRICMSLSSSSSVWSAWRARGWSWWVVRLLLDGGKEGMRGWCGVVRVRVLGS